MSWNAGTIVGCLNEISISTIEMLIQTSHNGDLQKIQISKL